MGGKDSTDIFDEFRLKEDKLSELFALADTYKTRYEAQAQQSGVLMEQAATDATKQEVEGLQQEAKDLEKKLTEIAKKVKKYREDERRRKPTKFKLED